MKKYGRVDRPLTSPSSQFASHGSGKKTRITDYFAVSTENAANVGRRQGQSGPDKKQTTRQSFLDLGQANFLFTECKECGIKYDSSFESEVRLHRRHHRFHTSGMLLKVDQQEIIGRLGECCAVEVRQRKRRQEIMHLVNDKLNAVELGGEEQVFGVVDREGRLCSVAVIDPDPAALKVSRIWTRTDVRRRGLATFLLDSIRRLGGGGGQREAVQFSAPTSAGRAFAQAYTNTDNFVVYR